MTAVLMVTSQMSRRKTALMTGASGGIGYELAKIFAREGYDLVLVARSQQPLDQLAQELRNRHGVWVKVLVKDLAAPRSPQEIVEELARESIPIDVLVNNAGFGIHGAFANATLSSQVDMMQVNMIALTQLTKLCLPQMLTRREGKILHVASTAAFQPGPLMAVYYATKAYVLSFSEALADELRGTGVTVTALCPGPTRSGFQQRAGMGSIRLFRSGVMEAATVARVGYRGLMQGTPVVIAGFKNACSVFLVRLTPRRWVTRIVRFLQERRGEPPE